VNKAIFFPLAAILIAAPAWAGQNTSTSPSLKLSTTALSFNGTSGNVSSQPLTITATGRTPITITSVSFSNSAFSTPSIPLPYTLSSGQIATGQISAHPESTAQTGKLTIGTSVGTYTVSLSETATAQKPASHSVSLTWKAPSSSTDPVDSYQVDRAVSGSTQYSTVGTTTAASTAFADTSVQAGTTYHYEVRSVDDQGNASGPSNTVTLTIP
jgi:hypothetical protein